MHRCTFRYAIPFSKERFGTIKTRLLVFHFIDLHYESFFFEQSSKSEQRANRYLPRLDENVQVFAKRVLRKTEACSSQKGDELRVRCSCANPISVPSPEREGRARAYRGEALRGTELQGYGRREGAWDNGR